MNRKLLTGVVVGAAVIAAALVVSYRAGFFRFTYPDSARYPVRGIDVSHHQGAIDWKQLPAQGVRFAYIKASEGGDWHDSSYASYVAGARKAGIPIGAYHYFSFCAAPALQLRNFLDATRDGKGLTLPPAVDVEYVGNCGTRPTQDQFVANLQVVLAGLEAQSGKRPIIYSTKAFYQQYLSGSALDGYEFWMRDLFDETYWAANRKVLFRQFANNGRFDGIKGNVDVEFFAGSQADFAALLAKRPSRASRSRSRSR